MSTTERSVFSKIIDRELPADIVFENDRLIAFNDIAPKAPVHVVIVPKESKYRDVTELAASDPGLLAELVTVANGIADDTCNGEFRLVFNTGAAAGQTVFHAHGHILGGQLTEGSIAN